MALVDQDAMRREMTARLEQFAGRVGSIQQMHLNELLARRQYLSSNTALFDPLGHPVVLVGSWISHEASTAADTALDIAESSLMAYLHIRLQDDHLDDGIASAETVMLLGDALLARHSGLLARHVTATGFWDSFEALWAAYAEAMLLERSLHRSESVRTAHDFEQLLDRSRPLAIPGLAVLAIEDRLSDAPNLMTLVDGIVRSGQLVTDLMDAPADLAAGRRTWIVERLDGRQGASALKRAMVREFDTIVGEASAALTDAAAAAEKIGAGGATLWINRRQDRLVSLRTTFFETLFSPLLAADGE